MEAEKYPPRPDIRLLRLDETENWKEALEATGYAPFVKSISVVRFYDATVHTYCCEPTPSFALWRAGCPRCSLRIDFTEKPPGMAFPKWEALQEKIREWAYSLIEGDDEVEYYSVGEIERRVQTCQREGRKGDYFHAGDPLPDFHQEDLEADEDFEEAYARALQGEYCTNWLL